MTALESLVLCLARQAHFRLACREDDFSRADQARELAVLIEAAQSEIVERAAKQNRGNRREAAENRLTARA